MVGAKLFGGEVVVHEHDDLHGFGCVGVETDEEGADEEGEQEDDEYDVD